MHSSIQILMDEHRVIERVLASLEAIAERIAEVPGDGARALLRDYGDFFRSFADRCHHAKEEDLLFAKMTEHGFPREFGPIAVMLSEHTDGRACVAALLSAGEGNGPLSEGDREGIQETARRYVSLLRAHILKEDNILYPMALQALTSDELDALAESYASFENDVTGATEFHRLQDLAERLCEAYPPDPADVAASPSCFGCPSHG
jgi:hemerythrin-like domain-containing protein